MEKIDKSTNMGNFDTLLSVIDTKLNTLASLGRVLDHEVTLKSLEEKKSQDMFSKDQLTPQQKENFKHLKWCLIQPNVGVGQRRLSRGVGSLKCWE